MAGQNGGPSRWEKTSAVANVVMAFSAVITTGLAAVSVWFLFTQTPLFEGTQPQLTYWIDRSNSLEMDSDGLMASTVAVTIWNKSGYPAKDVYIVIYPLGKTGWSIVSRYPAEDLSRPGTGPRVVLVRTVPANTGVTVECIERVSGFPEKIERWGDELPPRIWNEAAEHEDELNRLAGNSELNYAGDVAKVYSEYGDLFQTYSLARDQFQFVPEDHRSDEGQRRREAMRLKMDPPPKVR